MFIKILLSNVTFQLPEYQTNKIKKILKKKIQEILITGLYFVSLLYN